MKPDTEIRLEIVRLLLQNSSADNIDHDRIIESADKLSRFVIDGNQVRTTCQPKIIIESIIQDLDSQGPLALVLEKWLMRNERLRAFFRASHQKAPTSPLGRTATAYLHRDRHPNKR